jgi:hypothetical protein
MLVIVDGDEEPFIGEVLLHIHNSQNIQPQVLTTSGPSVLVKVPFHDGPGDSYAISVSADGYRDSGCFFTADPKVLAEPKLLLLRNHPTPQFLSWVDFKRAHPSEAAFVATGQSDSEAQAHYEGLINDKPDSLACLLNLTQAMSEIDLAGRSPLSYFKQICWDCTLAQDRFFGYVDPAIIPAVRAAAARGEFAEERDCAQFHPGSTCSWKQVTFTVSNVQLTFHEHDQQIIGGVSCVKIEPDIDLYRDLLEHGFGEVFPNLLTKGLTSPFDVFTMRWTTAQDGQGPSFDPGYELA